MDYLTEEELYELEHQDEFDVLNDMEPSDFVGNGDFDSFSKYMSFLMGELNSRPVITNTCSLLSDNIVSNEEDNPSLCSQSAHSIRITENKQVEDSKDIFVENSERNVLQNCSSYEVNLSAKRKLSFDVTETDGLFKSNGSSLSQTNKRKMAEISDEESNIEIITKKMCNSIDVDIDSNGICVISDQQQSHSRSYLFDARESLTITKSDGRRIYFTVKDEEEECNNIQSFSQKTSSLLPTSIDILKSQYFIMEEQLLKGQQTTSVEDDIAILEDKENIQEQSLWVEKYRPLSYMHLLSEEGINRTLLQWLKLWDKVVFGKEKKIKKKPVEPKKPTKFHKNWGELIEDLDEHGRPYHKVAFLCGPPGLGKTTLATIIAKHVGYNVVEINASDDRNPEAFRTSLEASTQMKSVLSQDQRPNCLILDEIDGAPAASINVLLSFIKSVGVPKGQKRKKGDIPLLTRPIICICNDQYSPALKPLRQLALVLNFPTTATSRLAARLYEVSSQEGFNVETAALSLLCEKTCNDIRSCLSTLQFLHRKKNELKASDLEGLQIGQKDMQKSLFAVWQDVFYYKAKKSFLNTYNVIQAFGDYDKIYIGVFENYLNVKLKHRNFDVVWLGSEWLCFADIVQQQIAYQQLYFLTPYLPYPAVAFHVLFSSNSYPHISYPSGFYEHKVKGSQLSNTLSSLIKDIISSLKTFLSPVILLTEVFPFLVEIIKPNLRPVNSQLYSEREKNELRRVIELMLAFNLNYHQERSLEGTYNYVLDPNIEELIKFSDVKPKKVLTYSAKQMIAREVEMEQMRKSDSVVEKLVKKPFKNTSVKQAEPKIFQKKEIIADKPVLDFFGRQIVQSAKVDKESKDARDGEIWFHFKEGYTNAVRRTVYVKDFM
ncbi:chromosome transmission fidelity protein 18 homolog [Nephila pilipes]|uniref:Chromosome transmission fidelity protein 18 homolog n=1 Tax=Nephila pilipes TaxID=299642 RepID=A0A8X6MU19_NEPPI|nr:chromosome transmission fidelity protein 18 homolog [Nephila pilipes]